MSAEVTAITQVFHCSTPTEKFGVIQITWPDLNTTLHVQSSLRPFNTQGHSAIRTCFPINIQSVFSFPVPIKY